MIKLKSKTYRLYLILAILLAAASTVYLLEKNNVINLYRNDSQATTAPQSTVNGINYDPATTTDNEDINAKKQSSTVDQASTTTTNPDLAVVITNSRKSGSLYLIKAVIAGTDSATCSATMTKGSTVATGNSEATIIEGQYSCKDLSIPLSQLPESGEWNLKLTITDKTGATASTSSKVIL